MNWQHTTNDTHDDLNKPNFPLNTATCGLQYVNFPSLTATLIVAILQASNDKGNLVTANYGEVARSTTNEFATNVTFQIKIVD